MSSQQTVPILHHAARLVRVLAENQGQLSTIQELAQAADMSTTSCFRVINTLEQEHWITRTGHKRGGYRLSVGLLPVLKSLQDRQRVFEAAAGELQALADRVGLAAKLSVREGDEAVTVLRAEPATSVSVTNPVGSRFPLAFGATGAALLTELSSEGCEGVIQRMPDSAWRLQQPEALRRKIAQCRQEGWCADFGSFHPQLAGVSRPVPILGMVVAMTVTGLLTDLEARAAEDVVDAMSGVQTALHHAAEGIEPSAPALAETLPPRSSNA